MDKVTTVIANYNYHKFIGSAIRSALKQTYPNNICVVDDCSDIDIDELTDYVFVDEKPEFVVTHELGTSISSPSITLIRLKENRGPAFARNVAIKQFWDSDYFNILDADDMMAIKKIERLLKEMNDTVGAVYADYWIQNEGKFIMEFKRPYDKQLLNKDCIVHSNSLINKKALEKVGLYDESLRVCEDYDLWLRISNHFLIRHVPEFLSSVRNHENNSTNSVSKEVWKDCYSRVFKKEK